MRRREFIAGFVTLGTIAGARAQSAAPSKQIGMLIGGGAVDPELQARVAALKSELASLGWSEGRVRFVPLFAEGNQDKLPDLATQLVEVPVDVIVSSGSPATAAAKRATAQIPIVMVAVGDAVAAGFIASLARPGGNITGQTLVATEQSAKRLELVKEILPGTRRVGVLWNRNNAGHSFQYGEMDRVAPNVGIELVSVPIRDGSELETSLRQVASARATALITMDDTLIGFLRARTATFCLANKLAFVGEFKLTPMAGGLVSYGPNQAALWRLIAGHIDKILKGVSPAELPVHQPTTFELVINLKTAKAIGITIPPTLLARADEVIE
jgi:ABC-type uncharacterized transport system substrate-binding protein